MTDRAATSTRRRANSLTARTTWPTRIMTALTTAGFAVVKPTPGYAVVRVKEEKPDEAVG